MALTLSKQLELTRFHRALEVCDSLAHNRALLTNMELERMNMILNGKEPGNGPVAYDPWRKDTVELTLPSGKKEVLQLLKDPKNSVRECLHHATGRAEEGDPIDAALDAYCDLVQTHPFVDANRRTAVLAAHYFLIRYGIPLTGVALHEIGLGDVRDPKHRSDLRDTFHRMAKFAMGKS